MEKQIKEITDIGAWLEPDCFLLNIRNYFVQSTIERLEFAGFPLLSLGTAIMWSNSRTFSPSDGSCWCIPGGLITVSVIDMFGSRGKMLPSLSLWFWYTLMALKHNFLHNTVVFSKIGMPRNT